MLMHKKKAAEYFFGVVQQLGKIYSEVSVYLFIHTSISPYSCLTPVSKLDTTESLHLLDVANVALILAILLTVVIIILIFKGLFFL